MNLIHVLENKLLAKLKKYARLRLELTAIELSDLFGIK